MPLGVRVSQAGSETGGHRLISVCWFYKPRLAQMGCRENEDLEYFFLFFDSLFHFLWLIHTVSQCFSILLSIHMHCFSQGQVWSLPCLCLSSLCFSPPAPSIFSYPLASSSTLLFLSLFHIFCPSTVSY